MLVHASDLGGQALPRASRLNWSARILAEFASQAAAERALGLPTAPFMLGLDDGLRAARLQLSFVQSVVLRAPRRRACSGQQFVRLYVATYVLTMRMRVSCGRNCG